ncbi:cobalt transporter CbiM [Olsenella profusa]|uniref:Cobalt uptake substrate-specific transmembrane region n=1 Tax=Olsenella profusa F0195 TaxID=1125712 RepID=U2VBK2_9ACTN|nr:cobalt transporter CbiM [Olsenella profusa]ERL09971.1 cobalt uptake substrate-specific transmembrane region [Olsenella profusa F0195]
MHIPENYLSPSTCGVMVAAMAPVWAHAARRVRDDLPAEKVSLLGVAAAFSFLAMMFNVPIPGGTTGHAVCGTLVAILFGPWPALLAISMALAMQAFLFGDGGVLALGANCFNLAFVLPMVGFGAYRLVRLHARGARGELVAAGVGSYLGINAAALCAATELGVQPLLFVDAAGQALFCPYPLWVSVPAMLVGHLTVWGAAEVVFTVGILAYVRRVAPSFGAGVTVPDGRRGTAGVAALLAALAVATPLGLLATGDAWGEWSAGDLAARVGYMPGGMGGWQWAALLPDYSLGGLPGWVGYMLSAVIGVALLVVVFRLAVGLARPEVDFDGRA